MLEQILKKFQGFMLVLLITLLVVVFVVQFGGPQAEGCTYGGTTYAAKVYDSTITLGDFESNYILYYGMLGRPSTERAQTLDLRRHVMDGLVERTLLARAARELGYDVSEDEAGRHVQEEHTMLFTLGIDTPPEMVPENGEVDISGQILDRDGNYDVESARSFVQDNLRRSVTEFIESQIEEHLARRMRRTVEATVDVSPREVWDSFRREQDRVKVKYVRYSPRYYRDTLRPTDEEIRAWMADHVREVDTEYQANRHRFTGIDEQVRARHILIKAGEDADEATRTAARTRTEGLLARIRAGEDFATLARENSEDPGSAVNGGDLGWNPRGRMVPQFDEAMFGLEEGAVSDVVETRYGYHIIRVDDHREAGDVPEDEAKRELAEELYAEARSTELAREAATAAHAALRGGQTMDDLERELNPPPPESEGEEGEGEGEEEEEDEPERHPLAPEVQETRLFGRTDPAPISGSFDPGPFVRAAFERTMEEPLAEEPLQLGDDWVVFQLVEKQEATREAFTEQERQRLTLGLLRAKQREALSIFIENLREEAEADGAIRVNEEQLSYEESDRTQEPASGGGCESQEQPAEGEGEGEDEGEGEEPGGEEPEDEEPEDEEPAPSMDEGGG